ncbi:MAG: hypothetical protein ACRD5I_12595 [Candidatus Acidiferrales bacterium]
MADRQCGYCGKTVSDKFLQCPYCREDLSASGEKRRTGSRGLQGAKYIRRGLLYMALGGVCYYLFGGYHPLLTPPFDFEPWLTDYVLPFIILSGLGLMVFGVIRRYSG